MTLERFHRFAEEREFRLLIVLLEDVPAEITEGIARTAAAAARSATNGHLTGRSNALWAECIGTWFKAELI